MQQPLSGIHHITALASDPQRNVDFYTEVLGLRLVKRTVNFDAPDVYHFYFGDAVGQPGTILTFFPFVHAARGKRGSGEIAAVAYSVSRGSEDFWINRLSRMGMNFEGPEGRFGNEVIAFPDPDGMMVELVFAEEKGSSVPWKNASVPPEHAVGAFHGATFWTNDLRSTTKLLVDAMGFGAGEASGVRQRLTIGTASIDLIDKSHLPQGRQSAGSVHHIAWRVASDEGQQTWRETIGSQGLYVTEILDRQYFRSIYFREPGGILFEIATDGPGFLVDEPEDRLGLTLKLPPWLEERREAIERRLPPVELKRGAGQSGILEEIRPAQPRS